MAKICFTDSLLLNHLENLFQNLIVLDYLMTERRDNKELLDLFTKHSFHNTLMCLCEEMFPPGKYAKSISKSVHYIVAFKNLRDQLAMKNFLVQAFPSYWSDVMTVYEKVTGRPFGYMVLDLHRTEFASLVTFSRMKDLRDVIEG